MKPIVLALALVSACATHSGPVETVALPPAPPPGPWQVMRSTIAGCAQDLGLPPDVQVRITFDQRGYPLSIASRYGDGFAQCVGNNIMRTRFRDKRERQVVINLIPGDPVVERPACLPNCE